MMWNALTLTLTPHPLLTTPPSPPLQTCSGLGRLQDRRTKQQIKASSFVHIAGSRRASEGDAGREQSSAVCVCVCLCVLQQTEVGHSCLVEGILDVWCFLCVFLGGVWPLSDSLHRESSAFHKCISVSSQRDKNTQRLKREWEFRGVEGWLTD